MQWFNHRFAILLLSGTLAACGGSGKLPDAGPAQEALVTEAISGRPWLRERLPADTIGYVRVPSPWGLLAAPNNRAADAMFASRAHAEAIRQLRESIAGNPILADVLGNDGADRYIRALSTLSAPIEAAVVDPGRSATPAAQVLVSTVLNERDPELASRHLATLIGAADHGSPQLDEDGYGELLMPPLRLPMHFDRDSGRAHLLGGMSPSIEQLRRLLGEVREAGPREHALHTLESEIDSGGQGLLVWLDVRAFRPWMAMGSGGDASLRALYEPVQALAFGWGGVDGHGRLSLRAQLENPPWLRYLPQAPRRLDLRSSGEPGFIVSLAIPTSEDLARILAAITEDHGEDTLASWHEFERFVETSSGLSLSDWLAPFGPELVLFNDDAGFFSAIRIRDRTAWRRVLDTVTGHGGELHTRSIAGSDFHHLSFRMPQPLDVTESAAAAGLTGLAVLGWWQNLPGHSYWVEEDDWLISASVPQPLIDRVLLGVDHGLEHWLREYVGDDRGRALLSGTTRSRDLARWYYHTHLTVLQRLGDMVGTPLDLFALPSARQLELPRDTGLGLQLVADHERLALDLNYEITPFDGVMSIGGGYTTVMVAAILAAIAVPAYQDYIARASAASAIAAAAPLRLAISEHYAAHGSLPQAVDLADLLERQPVDLPAQILFEGGAIRIRFTAQAPAGLAGEQLYLHPHVDESGQIGFACGLAPIAYGSRRLIEDLPIDATTVPEKLLPASCRS